MILFDLRWTYAVRPSLTIMTLFARNQEPERMKPLIGITTSGRHENNFETKYYQSYFTVPDFYVEAVRRAGGVPVLLPPGDLTDAETLIQRLDGFIITGGADVHPDHYDGNSAHPSLTTMDAERDDAELHLVRLLADQDRPTLCVCRGMQLLNVALGGSLTEHIPDIREQDLHRSADGGWTMHPVHISEGSRLAELTGTHTVETFSGHHQAAKHISERLRVVAQSPDGIVEALEMPAHRWLIGVQWHPEKSAADDPTQQRIFDGLVRAARETD